MVDRALDGSELVKAMAYSELRAIVDSQRLGHPLYKEAQKELNRRMVNPRCPQCGAEQCGAELEHRQHRFSSDRGPNLPDCDWMECPECDYRTDPE